MEKERRITSIRSLITLALTLVLVFTSSIPVLARTSVDAATGLKNLVTSTASATYKGSTGTSNLYDYSDKAYETSNGGFYIYEELTKDGNTVNSTSAPIDAVKLNNLTSKSKQEFVEDYYTAGTIVAEYDQNQNSNNSGITDQVQTNWLTSLQNTNGVGSQLMTTLMSNTKPDWTKANSIYEPFSGTVGTCLALLAIVIMAGVALTMTIDLAYIGVPAAQMVLEPKEGKKGFISLEAKNAVKAAESGGDGENAGKSVAVWTYFKSRVVMLVALGICLLYLVQGQIFAFVGWFTDLFSGIVGF